MAFWKMCKFSYQNIAPRVHIERLWLILRLNHLIATAAIKKNKLFHLDFIDYSKNIINFAPCIITT